MNLPAAHEKSVPLDRLDAALAFVVGMVSFGIYIRTLMPGLLPSDSAEFQTLAYTLDHAHTTGYHVYLVLAKLFTLLPVGDIAYRVNLFSAFMGGMTVALVYLSGKSISGSRWVCVFAAMALAITATFWSQAVIAEVYTAGSAFTTAVILLVLLWHHTGQNRFLFSAGILGGLGIGVHGSIVLLAPAVLLLILLRRSAVRTSWKPALLGGLLGLVLFAAAFYLIDLRTTNASIMHTYISSISRWDLTPEQINSSWERFRFLVLARQWRSAMFNDPVNVIPANWSVFLSFFSRDFHLVVPLFGIVGLALLLVRDWRIGLFFLFAVVGHAVFTLNYRIGDIYVFFIPAYVYIVVVASEGLAFILGVLSGMMHRWIKFPQPVLALTMLVMIATPSLALYTDFLVEGRVHWDFMKLPTEKELKDWHDTIRSNVADIPGNAIVLADWSHLYGYAYVAQIEQNRPDLLFIEAYPYAAKSGMADSLFDYLKSRIAEGRPILTLEQIDELDQGDFMLSERLVGVTRMYEVSLR